MIPGSLSLENVGLRGTQVIHFSSSSLFFSEYNSSKRNYFQLRNTDYVYGCAVYTGRDTKMSRVCKEYFVKNADSLFPELKAGQKQVFDCGGDDEQGAPRLHAHPCP